MGSFASKELTPQEQMRQYKREIDRAIRELERERQKLERQNERLAVDMRKAAKANQTPVVKIMAKDYVRTKAHVQKFLQLRTYLQGVAMQLQTMKSVDAMASAMKNATRAMMRMNARLNIPQLQSVMAGFAHETAHLEDTTDMIGDTLDSVFAVEGEEEEEATIMSQITTELNLQWPDAPVGTSAIGTGAAVAAAAAPAAAARTAVGAGAGGAGAGAGAAASAPPAAPGSGKPPGSDGGSGGGGGGAAAAAGGGSDLASRLAALRGGGAGAAGGEGGPTA